MLHEYGLKSANKTPSRLLPPKDDPMQGIAGANRNGRHMKIFSVIAGRPIDDAIASTWNSVPATYRRALLIILLVNFAAFGYEMSNLSFHHDDVNQFFRSDATLGHQLGRPGYSWLHYYVEGNYYLPFFQLLQGILCTAGYAMVAASAWRIGRTADIAAVGSIICAYPYMAQMYQYNTVAFPYALAHLLAGLAVLCSLHATMARAAIAAVLYAISFSIYQSVIGNALSLLAFAMVARALETRSSGNFASSLNMRDATGALIAVIGGGLLYLLFVKASGIHIDAYQNADKAFSLSDGIDVRLALSAIVSGSRNALFWPENYFPLWLKQIQVALLGVAFVLCIVVPRTARDKAGALFFFGLGLLTPRALQALHPTGTFHNLTLTAYATVTAASLMIVLRAGTILVRNLAIIAAAVLSFGYILQANWISTVNSLNWSAHQLTASEILSRVDQLPRTQWDGKLVAVVGKFEFPDRYPFRRQTGMAVSFIDEEHLGNIARLMRRDLEVRRESDLPEAILHRAAAIAPWPAAESVSTVDGMALVVLSSPQVK